MRFPDFSQLQSNCYWGPNPEVCLGSKTPLNRSESCLGWSRYILESFWAKLKIWHFGSNVEFWWHSQYALKHAQIVYKWRFWHISETMKKIKIAIISRILIFSILANIGAGVWTMLFTVLGSIYPYLHFLLGGIFDFVSKIWVRPYTVEVRFFFREKKTNFFRF